MAQKTKAKNSINPIAVIVCALKACKSAADYHRIAGANSAIDLNQAWQSLSTEEQQRINDLVNNSIPTAPQTIADELIACDTALELRRVKAEHGENAVKAAWKLLPSNERDRINAICSGCAAESKSQMQILPETPPIAESSPDEKQPRDISQMSLAELSAEALNLWEQLETAEDDSALLEVLQGIEKKVDALAWVDEQYSLNIEATQVRLQRLTELHTAAINRMRSKQQALRDYLLRLHSTGVIQHKLIGSERALAIRQNPPKCEILVEPESLPEQFVEVETKTTVKPQKKAIIEAWKRGEDVSSFAEISTGYRVQFGFTGEVSRKKTGERHC